MNLWYHDGTGYGWPAIETRRTETTTVQPDGTTVTDIVRDLVVFYTGPDGKVLKPGANVTLGVPEGPPAGEGTCSHIAWQPGTDAHAAAVMNGIAEREQELADQAERLRLSLLETELAREQLAGFRAARAAEHMIGDA